MRLFLYYIHPLYGYACFTFHNWIPYMQLLGDNGTPFVSRQVGRYKRSCWWVSYLQFCVSWLSCSLLLLLHLFLFVLNLFMVLILWRFGTCSFSCLFLLLLIERFLFVFLWEDVKDGFWFPRSDGCSFVLSSLFHVDECGGGVESQKRNGKRKADFLLPAFDLRASHSVVSEFWKVAKRLQTLV